ncbi:DUF2953 domain-containing protein [Clostridium niameyense]|uniref:DUF2953 domain-containing protein n=1 Tax=Clostridium niameyense TaxID=1622073 RepID=A0A6M0R7R5_9CLOT|nr:DUF2953 domain-containing protein [Clostridium niameyense]NEZ46271.1 DUF2953 domain-containing protein [Clostridium niameyense]
MFFYILLFIIILFIFLPIPIKISVVYKNNLLKIYIFNKTLSPKKPEKKLHNKNKTPQKIDKRSLLKIKIMINLLKSIKLKPKSKLYFNLDYDLEDASHTAIIYGILYSFSPIIHNFFKNMFSIKEFKLMISPLFKNDFYINFKFNGIFYISLVKIIYITILFKRKLKNIN